MGVKPCSSTSRIEGDSHLPWGCYKLFKSIVLETESFGIFEHLNTVNKTGLVLTLRRDDVKHTTHMLTGWLHTIRLTKGIFKTFFYSVLVSYCLIKQSKSHIIITLLFLFFLLLLLLGIFCSGASSSSIWADRRSQRGECFRILQESFELTTKIG